MMVISTSRFGEVEIEESQVIVFPEGIPGFPGRQRFVLLNEGLNDTPFWWLQNADDGNLSFLTVEPAQIAPGYDFPIPQEMIVLLGLSTASTIEALAIVSVPDGDLRRATVNLKAPVLINPRTKLGGQLVLDHSPYAIRQPLFAATEV